MFELITRSNYRFNSEDCNYYVDNTQFEPLLLYERDKKNVRFFNPNPYECLQCSERQFKQMLKDKTLEKAKYLLCFSCDYSGYSEKVYCASVELDKIYSQLKRLVRAHNSEEIKFTSCFVKDLETKNHLVVANNIAEVEQSIEKYNEALKIATPVVKKSFKPSIINIQNLLSSIGFRKKNNDSQPGEIKSKSKGR